MLLSAYQHTASRLNCSANIEKITHVLNPTLDAPFEAKYVLKALEPFSLSSPAYKLLKITEQEEFDDYLRDHPNAFSWKTVAEVLYRCGDEKRLDSLFMYMKSPEGKFLFHSSLILCVDNDLTNPQIGCDS